MSDAMTHRLRFHSKLYPRKAIDEAIDAYEEFAKFQVNKDNDYYVVDVTILEREHADYLADEFANYTLGEAASIFEEKRLAEAAKSAGV